MRSLCRALAFAACIASSAVAAEVSDPIEPVNRGIFWFNDKADVYVLEPTAKGWDYVLPERVQTAVANFFDNVRFPVVMINNLLQGKVVAASSDVGRFLVNTTIGVLGFFDPASGYGLEQHDEDFGQTLGYWGIPPGPYLVAPLLGPTNVRDGVGRIADTFTAIYPIFAAIQYTIGATAVNTLNYRAQVLDEVREAKAASLDYYVFVRDAYDQRRRTLIRDQPEVSAEAQEELYFGEFDDGEDDEDDENDEDE
jgi:phospholipid-binding lipoprotein MlaA